VVAGLLETLRSLGVTVKVVAGERVRLEPASRIPAELVPQIREAKPEIIAALRRPAPDPGEDSVRRFAQPHAKLFPLLGRKVRTPAGVGVLWQVFEQQSGVLLDKEAARIVSYFRTSQIEPVSQEP